MDDNDRTRTERKRGREEEPEPLALQRQTSEDLQQMLAKALNTIEDQKPDQPALAIKESTPSGLPPVSTMIAVLHKIRNTVHMISGILKSRHVVSKIADWKYNARRAAIPSLFYDLAVSAFEGVDQGAYGTVTQLQANVAFRGLLSKAQLELGVCCDHVPQQLKFEEGDERVGLSQFILAMDSVQFPVGLQSAAQAAIHGLRCECGSWMTKRPRAECYPGGAVRCDFTGESVVSDTVWHCDRNRAAAVHPFGFDVAGENAEAFREFKLRARLHKRLGNLILAGSEHDGELRTRRAECAAALVPAVSSMYLSIRDDITNAKAAGRTVSELEDRLKWCRSLLENEDWKAHQVEARAQVEATISSLQQFCDSLSHDKLHFTNKAHRDQEIARFSQAFEPAARHAKFEADTGEFRRVSAFVKDLVGFEQFEADDPDAAGLMDAFAQQILNGLMAQRALMFVELEHSYEQMSEGVKFRWKLAIAPTGQHLLIEHIVALDKSDLEHAHMHRKFMTLYHEVQERIKGLEQCATDEDLLDQLTEFQISAGDECCGQMCVICQDDMTSEEQALKINSCAHCFHRDCVKSWLLGCKQECPICKVPVKTQPAAEKSFSNGVSVRLQGLQARPELNGVVGQVVGLVRDSGRYRVSTQDHGVLSVLPKNMVEIQQPPTAEGVTAGAPQESEDQDFMDAQEASSEDEDLVDANLQAEEDADLQAALALSLEMSD